MHQKVSMMIFVVYAQLKIEFKFTILWSCLVLSSSSFPPKKMNKKNLNIRHITTFLCHAPLAFPTRALLLPLLPQNVLDHVSG